MTEEPYTKRLLDRLMTIQYKYYQHFKRIYDEEGAEGRAGILQIVGPDGGSFKLQLVNGLLKYANPAVEPFHIIKITEDTFLSLLTGETDISSAFDKGKCKLIEYSSGVIDLVEMTKWKGWFKEMRGILKKILKF